MSVLENLTDREKAILKERFGIDTEKPLDPAQLEQLPALIELVEKEALEKLRGSNNQDDS